MFLHLSNTKLFHNCVISGPHSNSWLLPKSLLGFCFLIACCQRSVLLFSFYWRHLWWSFNNSWLNVSCCNWQSLSTDCRSHCIWRCLHPTIKCHGWLAFAINVWFVHVSVVHRSSYTRMLTCLLATAPPLLAAEQAWPEQMLWGCCDKQNHQLQSWLTIWFSNCTSADQRSAYFTKTNNKNASSLIFNRCSWKFVDYIHSILPSAHYQSSHWWKL